MTPPASGPRSRSRWVIRGGELDLTRPRVMGILNLTPDSFSDGGTLRSVEEAMAKARTMVEEGAAILDVGGESTRPGASAVPVEEEARRVVPFIRRAAAELGVPISVDTRKAAVAERALEAGACIVNDVSALRFDPDLAGVVARTGAGIVLSHMRGTPADMRERAAYDDVVAEVVEELRGSLLLADRAGIPRERTVVDPGIGFAKTGAQSLRLLRELGRMEALGRPILVGPSRKSFIGEVTGAPPGERLAGTLAACVLGYLRGARIFRVHDVAPAVQALAVAEAIEVAGGPAAAAGAGEAS